MLNGPHIVFAGGGALGNLYPGLAIAEYLREQLPAAQVTFVGDGRAVERHTIRGAGYSYVAMPGRSAPSGPLEAVRFVTDNFAGFWASRWMVREQQVSLVVGMGGPASAVMVRAAHGRGIPFFLLEQNATPSRTTRRLGHAAEAVCGACEELRAHLPVGAPLTLTGVPGRPSFERLFRRTDEQDVTDRHYDDLLRLVVIGGVGGAATLNESMPSALKKLGPELAGWNVIHQSGEGQLQATEQRYQSAGVPALVVSYIDEMASLFSETDLVVCRSGGAALAELALAGAPAILVPRPDGEGHLQHANAAIVAGAGAAVIVDEQQAGEPLEQALSHELRLLLADNHRRAEMARAMRGLARPEAAEKIAEMVCETLCSGGRMAA